jgi:hypothetical protein
MLRDARFCAVPIRVPFPRGYDAVGLCSILNTIDAIPLSVKASSFWFSKFSAGNPTINPMVLVRLPLIDDRRFALRKSHPGEQHRHPKNYKDCSRHSRLL